MPCYEWSRKASVNKRIDTKFGARNPDNSFGTRYEYEQTAPEVTQTFEAHGIDWDGDLESLWIMSLVAIDLQTPVTITDKDGRAWSGKIYHLEAGPAGKGVNLFDATITLKYASRVG